MKKKMFRGNNSDLGALAKDLAEMLSTQNYEVQTQYSDTNWLIQAKKKQVWRRTLGISRSFNVLIQGTPDDFLVETGTGEWAANFTAVAATALLTGGLSLPFNGIAAAWTKKLEGDVMEFINERAIFGSKALSQEEYARAKKLKQLRDAFDAGIIDETAYNAQKSTIGN